MKHLYKSLMGVGLFALTASSLTSCIEEVEPTSIATEKQIATSASASKALCMAMPANFNYTPFFDSWAEDDGIHYCFGYGSIMHIRDIMTGDLAESTTNYSHWYRWAYNQYQGQDYRFGQYFWNYYYKFILSTNNCIGNIDPATANEEQLGYLGAGLAFRALLYLDLARMYEFLPNDKTSNINAEGNDVLGLTVPIIKAGMSADDAASNPRATHADMFAFIEEDLKKAEEYIVNLKSFADNSLPDLACVYGLKARLYMWNEDYAKAKDYAGKAIAASRVKPISRTKYLDTKNGFNKSEDFMWSSNQTSEDWTVQTGIINWTSWMSNQTTFGYTGTGTYLFNMIDAKMYGRISDNDFRKLLFKAPEGGALQGQEPWLLASMADDEKVPAYTAIKFRPANGDMKECSTGAVASYPIMRVEEMYFIQAEAAAHLNPKEGLDLVTAFMKDNRNPSYSATEVDIIDEIVFQKRVELWGEGQTFFDIKRLNMSVTRGYKDTNFYPLARFNTDGRPAWMNLVIVQTEGNSNEAVKLFNNPDPSDLYTPWTE